MAVDRAVAPPDGRFCLGSCGTLCFHLALVEAHGRILAERDALDKRPVDSHVTGPILLGDVTSAVCAAILPRLAFSLACRASPKSRRLAPAGFTKSSMTASASSLGATLPACACHAERLQLRRSLSPHRRGDRRTARQFIRGCANLYTWLVTAIHRIRRHLLDNPHVRVPNYMRPKDP